MKQTPQKCFNCKHASSAFKIAGKTHYQCNHSKHQKGLENGALSAWDTLREFHETCESYEPKQPLKNETTNITHKH